MIVVHRVRHTTPQMRICVCFLGLVHGRRGVHATPARTVTNVCHTRPPTPHRARRRGRAGRLSLSPRPGKSALAIRRIRGIEDIARHDGACKRQCLSPRRHVGPSKQAVDVDGERSVHRCLQPISNRTWRTAENASPHTCQRLAYDRPW